MSGATDLAKDAAAAIIREIMLKLVADQIMKRLIAALPFLGLSFINPVVAFVLARILSIAADEIIKHINFLAIDGRNAKEAADYVAATEELKAAIEAGNREAIDNARRKTEKEMADLVFARRSA